MNVIHLHRAAIVEPWPCEWESCTGRCDADSRECLQSCAPEGGRHADPVAAVSMRRHFRTAATVQALWLGVVLGGVLYGLWHYFPALLPQ